VIEVFSELQHIRRENPNSRPRAEHRAWQRLANRLLVLPPPEVEDDDSDDGE
jgi:hypothetical protein